MTTTNCYSHCDQWLGKYLQLGGEYIRRASRELGYSDIKRKRDNVWGKDTSCSFRKVLGEHRGQKGKECDNLRHLQHFEDVITTGMNDDFRNTDYWRKKREADKRHLSKMVGQVFNGQMEHWAKGLDAPDPSPISGPGPTWFGEGPQTLNKATYKGSASNDPSSRAGYGYHGMADVNGKPSHSGWW